MHYRLPTTLVALVLGTAIHSFAQTGWVAGYIVPDKGDTLRGTIDNADWDISPTKIQFRTTVENTVTAYGLTDLKGFGVVPTNERYVRMSTRLDKTPQRDGQLPGSKRIDWVDDTFFAKQLVQGDLSLFTHKDSQGKTHYLIRRAGEVEQDLVMLRYLESDAQTATIEHYKQQLKATADEFPGLQIKLKTLGFNRESLTDFVDAYNLKRGGKSSVVQDKSNQKGRFDWGLSAGALRSNYSVSTTYEALYGYSTGSSPTTGTSRGEVVGKYQGRVLPSAGIWMLYSAARARQQWSLYGALNVQSINAMPDAGYTSAAVRGGIKATYVKLITGLHWMRPAGGRIRPFVMVGASNGLTLAPLPVNSLIGQRRHEQTLIGLVGCRVGRWQADVRYERGNGASEIKSIATRSTTIGLMLGYSLR